MACVEMADLEPQRLADGTVYYGQLGQLAYDPDEDKVQCHLCGEWFHCVGGPHLTHKHQWTVVEYRDAFHLPRGTPTIAQGARQQRRVSTTQAIAEGRIPPQSAPGAASVWNTPGRPQPPPSWRSLAALQPELARELHPTRNGDLDPRTLAPRSIQRVWWLCPTCGHEWQTRARGRARGQGCPRCRTRQRAEQMRDRARVGTLAKRRPDLVAQLHPSRNPALDLTTLAICSQRVLWCYEWQGKVIDRRRTTPPASCPACSRRLVAHKLRTVAPERSLAVRHPAIAAGLDPTRNDGLDPAALGAGSKQRVWWRCPTCGHEFQRVVKAHVYQHGRCPACHTQPA
jgi:rubrerythrin